VQDDRVRDIRHVTVIHDDPVLFDFLVSQRRPHAPLPVPPPIENM
jgi:hypothetical protein